MRSLGLLSALALVLLVTPLAHAAEIASPSIYGSSEQDSAECTIHNAGTGKVTVTIRVFDEAGESPAPPKTCTAMLPGAFCGRIFPITPSMAYACTATAGSIGNLRGALIIREHVPDGFGGTRTFAIRSAPLR
jgi:hypothetical protein